MPDDNKILKEPIPYSEYVLKNPPTVSPELPEPPTLDEYIEKRWRSKRGVLGEIAPALEAIEKRFAGSVQYGVGKAAYDLGPEARRERLAATGVKFDRSLKDIEDEIRHKNEQLAQHEQKYADLVKQYNHLELYARPPTAFYVGGTVKKEKAAQEEIKKLEPAYQNEYLQPKRKILDEIQLLRDELIQVKKSGSSQEALHEVSKAPLTEVWSERTMRKGKEVVESAPEGYGPWYNMGLALGNTLGIGAIIGVSMIPGVGETVIPGLLQGGYLLGMGVVSTGSALIEADQYEQETGIPLDNATKWGVAIANGVLEAGIEKMQLELLMPKGIATKLFTRNLLKNNPEFGKNLLLDWIKQQPKKSSELLKFGEQMLKGGNVEGLEEFLTQVGQDYANNLYKNPEDKTKFREVLNNAFKAYQGGAMAGVFLGPITYAKQAQDNKRYQKLLKQNGVTLASDEHGMVYEVLGSGKDPNHVQVMTQTDEVITVNRDDLVDWVDIDGPQLSQFLDAWANSPAEAERVTKDIYREGINKRVSELVDKIKTSQNTIVTAKDSDGTDVIVTASVGDNGYIIRKQNEQPKMVSKNQLSGFGEIGAEEFRQGMITDLYAQMFPETPPQAGMEVPQEGTPGVPQGFVVGEKVNYKGKDMIISQSTSDGLILQDDDGNFVPVTSEELGQMTQPRGPGQEMSPGGDITPTRKYNVKLGKKDVMAEEIDPEGNPGVFHLDTDFTSEKAAQGAIISLKRGKGKDYDYKIHEHDTDPNNPFSEKRYTITIDTNTETTQAGMEVPQEGTPGVPQISEKLAPIEQYLNMNVKEANNEWAEQSDIADREVDRIDDEIRLLKEELSGLKGRKKETITRRKAINDKIADHNTRKALILSKVERLALIRQEEFEKWMVEELRRRGIPYDEEQDIDFIGDVISAIYERPGVEQYWDTKVIDVFNDIVQDYQENKAFNYQKQAGETRPEVVPEKPETKPEIKEPETPDENPLPRIQADEEKLTKAYFEHSRTNQGRIVDPDIVRSLFGDYGYNGYNFEQFREAERWLTPRIFKKALQRYPTAPVSFITGVPGSGKSIVTRKGYVPADRVVYDGVMATEGNMERLLEMSKDREQTIYIIHSDPIRAFQGSIDRALRLIDRGEIPRFVSIDNMLRSAKAIDEREAYLQKLMDKIETFRPKIRIFTRVGDDVVEGRQGDISYRIGREDLLKAFHEHPKYEELTNEQVEVITEEGGPDQGQVQQQAIPRDIGEGRKPYQEGDEGAPLSGSLPQGRLAGVLDTDKTVEGQIIVLKSKVNLEQQIEELQENIKRLQGIQNPTKSQTKELETNRGSYQVLTENLSQLNEKIDLNVLDREKAGEIEMLVRENVKQNNIISNRIIRIQDERDAKEQSLQKRNELFGDRKAEEEKMAGQQSMFAGDALFRPSAENLQSALRPFNASIQKAEEEIIRNNQLLDEKIQLVISGAQGKLNFPEKETEVSAEPGSLFSAQKSKTKIEDFGEKIGGARKDIYREYAQKLRQNTDEDYLNKSLSALFPEPDYKGLVESGTITREEAAFIDFFRRNLPKRPQKAYKMHRWVEQVKLGVWITESIIDGKLFNGRTIYDLFMSGTGVAGKPSLSEFASRDIKINIDTLLGLGWPESGLTPGNLKIKYFASYSPPYAIISGNRILENFKTFEDAVAGLRFMLENKTKTERTTKLDFWSIRGQKGIYVGKKLATNKYITLNQGTPFDTAREAQQYAKEHYDELIDELEKSKQIPEERPSEVVDRSGRDRRNGKNITPEIFSEAFGFRGVEFGNWVENDRRQKDLNDAYDALMDLAEILNVPTRALSLGGQLGFAFGARGRGGKGAASAHYEPDKVVINLTKTRGPGSLAHEWWHAIDNYFSRMRERGGEYLTELPPKVPKEAGVYDESIRGEMIDAFRNIADAIKRSGIPERSAKLDAVRSENYWTQMREMTARSFESYIKHQLESRGIRNDYLVSFKDIVAYILDSGFQQDENRYPYPTKEESEFIDKAFEDFFSTIKTKEEEGRTIFFRTSPEQPVTGDQINDRFNEELVQFIQGNLKVGHVFELGNAGDILQSAGMPDLPIQLVSSRLKSKSLHKEHPFDLSEVKNLPNAVQNPLAVFISATQPNNSVILTEIEHKGKNFVVAIETNKEFRSVKINSIRSMYYRNTNTNIANWIVDGLMLYADKNRMSEWLSKQRYNSADVKQLFGHATNIVKKFDNPNMGAKKLSLFRNVHNPIKRKLQYAGQVLEKPTEDQIRAFHDEVAGVAEQLSDRLNTPIQLVHSATGLPVDVISYATQRIKSGQKVTGVYHLPSDTIYVIADQLDSTEELVRTVLHETVAHRGLRFLLGKDFINVLRDVYQGMSDKDKQLYARMYKTEDPSVIAEEYLALMAERDKKPNIIQQAIAKIRELIRKIFGLEYKHNDVYVLIKRSKRLLESKQFAGGVLKTKEDYAEALAEFNAYKDAMRKDLGADATKLFAEGMKANNNSIRDAIKWWKDQHTDEANQVIAYVQEYPLPDEGKLKLLITFHGMAPHKIEWGKASGTTTEVLPETIDETVRLRAIPATPTIEDVMVPTRIGRLEQKMADRMLPVRKWMERIRERGGRLTGFTDPYIQENLSHGAVKNAIERDFDRKLFKPLLNQIKQILKYKGGSFEDFQKYLKLKHATERNEYFDLQNDTVGQDYSGVTQMMEKDGWKGEMQAYIDKYVADYENGLAPSLINDLWTKINNTTRYTVDRWLNDGRITKEHHDELVGSTATGNKARWSYYVPLRGWRDDLTEIFDFQGRNISKEFNPNMKAEGRITESDDPIAYIVNMAHSAVIWGEKNKVKMAAAMLIQNNKEMTDLATFQRMYEVDTGKKDANGNPITYVAFQRPDQKLWDQGRVKTRFATDYKAFLPKSLSSERTSEVWINGERYLMVFTDPAIANALNKNDGAQIGSVLQSMNALTRYLSQVFTSRNPVWVPINQIRDVGYATLAHAIKGDLGLSAQFIGNLKKARRTIIEYLKYERGLPSRFDPVNDKVHQWYLDFMRNGAETGYIHLKSVDDIAEDIERKLRVLAGQPMPEQKTIQGKVLKFISAGRWEQITESEIIDWVVGKLDRMSIRSENLSRFGAYMTSKQQGKTDRQAAYDAKEITVNFNRKGTHSAWFGSLYAFFNANVQGARNLWMLGKKYPQAFVGVTSSLVALGFLEAMLNYLWGDDDDDDKRVDYAERSDYMKANFINIGCGEGKYISFPLPQGFRFFHGLGVFAFETVFSDDKSIEEGVKATISALFEAISPINPTKIIPEEPVKSFEEGVGYFIYPFLPTGFTPVADIMRNRNFAGSIIHKTPFTEEQKKLTARSQLYLRDVNPDLRAVTDFLFKIGGGDTDIAMNKKEVKGELKHVPFANINPSNVEHIITYYLGGLGRFINDVRKLGRGIYGFTAEALKDGDVKKASKEISINTIPILNALYRKSYTEGPQERYYEIVDKIREVKAYFNKIEKTGKSPSAELQGKIMWNDYVYGQYKDYLDQVDDYIKQVYDQPDQVYQLMQVKNELMSDFVEVYDNYQKQNK